MSVFEKCKHEWEIIVNEYEKSSFQKALENDPDFSCRNVVSSFVLGKKIIILQCKKCGKLNKTIESV